MKHIFCGDDDLPYRVGSAMLDCQGASNEGYNFCLLTIRVNKDVIRKSMLMKFMKCCPKTH